MKNLPIGIANTACQGIYVAMKVNEKIRLLCRLRKLKGKDLASALDVHPSTVSRWLGGKSEPDIRMFLRLARTLEVPMEFFVDEEMEEVPNWDSLTGKERALIEAAKVVGYDRAMRRLMNVPESKALPGESYGELDREGLADD